MMIREMKLGGGLILPCEVALVTLCFLMMALKSRKWFQGDVAEPVHWMVREKKQISPVSISFPSLLGNPLISRSW